MTRPPCPTCGRPSWKSHGGMGGHIMPDAEEICLQQGSQLCRAASAGRQAAQQWRPMETAPKGLDVRTGRPTVVALLHTVFGLPHVSFGRWSPEGWVMDAGWNLGQPLGWFPFPEPPMEGT